MRSVIIHISSIVSDQRCFLHEWGGEKDKKKSLISSARVVVVKQVFFKRTEDAVASGIGKVLGTVAKARR